MKRKILSLILVFAMTVSLLTVGTGAVEPTYGDTAGHWAESSIERWSGHGIIQGSNGLFDPNGQLTCAQLATILARLLKLPAAKDAGFTDNTADAWYYDAINRCAAAGILNGNGDGTVTPEAPISRERAMVMLARALGIEPIRKPDLTKYTDAAQVSSLETSGGNTVYTPDRFSGMDGYDTFLSGAQALLTVENPLADTDRRLILFRDSFGSSLAPLLLESYREITLVDLRYFSSSLLGDYVDFDGADVLFLYSTSILNSAMLFK